MAWYEFGPNPATAPNRRSGRALTDAAPLDYAVPMRTILAGLFLAIAPPAMAAGLAIADGKLTLAVDGAPLQTVLSDIAAAGGFELVLDGDFIEPVHVTLTAVPLSQAIRRLAGDHGLVMVIAPDRPDRLIAVRLYERAAAPPPPNPVVIREAAADDYTRRRQAIRALAEIGGPEAVIELVAAIDGPDRLIASQAVRALERIEDPAAAKALREALDHIDASVRRYAVRGLAAREAGAGLDDQLAAMLIGDSAPMVRRQAAQTLAERGHANSYWALQQAAETDPDYTVRDAAGAALTRLEDR